MVSLLRKIIRRLFRRPQFQYLVIVAKTLDSSLPAYQARIPLDWEILPPDIEEIEARLAHIPPEHRPDIEWRIHNGQRCCVAKHNGQIIHAHWTAFGKLYSYALDREYELADTEAYGHGAYTLPEFRRKGIHPAAACHMLQVLRDEGYKRVFGLIEPKNSAAMRMPEKLGYDKLGISGFIEVFGLRWYFHKDGGAFSALKRRNYWQKR
jgi:ribosomal protein S18 acetylase RimI-like enzyme